ncbi:Cuticular protein RR-1 motif 19, partial [Operophtera brumata]
IILAAFVAVCAAAPQYGAFNRYNPYNVSPTPYNPSYNQYNQNYVRPRTGIERNAAILRSDSVVNEGGYQFAYDTENGIHAEETGVENNGIQAQGGYSYTGDDGQVYSVRYTAGANGFQATGAHLPTPPPVPEAIARALQENARDEAAGIFDDGKSSDILI